MNAITSESRSHQYQRILRKAFEDTMNVLGDEGKHLLVTDQLLHIVYLSSGENTSLEKLKEILANRLGEECSTMFIEQVVIKMDEIYSDER